MGQRSQIIIRHTRTNSFSGETTVTRIARHLQWNWGIHMIQRAAQVVQQMQTQDRTGAARHYEAGQLQGILATFCVNRVTGTAMGLHETDDASEYDVSGFDNNNGLFLLDIDGSGNWSFALVVGTEDGGDCRTVTTAYDYFEHSRTNLNELLREEPDYLAELAHSMRTLTEAEQDHHMTQETANELYKKQPEQ